MACKHARWYFNVNKWNPSREEWLRLVSSVPNEELERINRFVYQEDSKTSLIGQALIRMFITQATKIPSNDIVLKRTSHGRPEICPEYRKQLGSKWPKTIDFNVSHSGDHCVLAGVWSYNDFSPVSVGVDVTKIVKKKTKQELERFLSLMSRREFTHNEWETVEKAPTDRQKCINFTRLWCLKESFIKATGLGLSFKLNRIDFMLEDKYKYNVSMDMLKRVMLNSTTVLVDGKLDPSWKFVETALDDEHIVAIGYNTSYNQHHSENSTLIDNHSVFTEISIDSLVKALIPLNGTTNEENWVKFCSQGNKQTRHP